MARSAPRERLSKLHGWETTRVYPIWRAARELTVAFGPTVSFINASYGYYRPFIPAYTTCERTRNALHRGEGEIEYRLTPRADEDIQAQANARADRPVNFPRAADTITGPRIISGSRLDPLLALIPRVLRTNGGRPSNNRGERGSSRFTAY